MQEPKWIDISITIKSGMAHWPSDPAVRIRRPKDMDKGDADNVFLISMSSHTGTHMDGPLHFFAKGKGLDKMPLDAAVGPARVLEIKDKKCIRVEELRHCRIRPGERIIFKTRNSYCRKMDEFRKAFVYISHGAAEYLASLKLSAVGVDYLSVGGYHKDGASVHKALLGAGVWIIEGLNLSGVRPGKYYLICLPLKILNSDGAPARAIIRPQGRNLKDSGKR